MLCDGDDTRIVLILHHGICDGRSVFALLDEMWRRYTALIARSPLPLHDSDTELVDGIDTLLTRVVSDAEVDSFLAQMRTAALATDPAAAPRRLPVSGDDDPSGRLTLQRIELSPAQTSDFIGTARAQGFSVNSLLAAAAVLAVRPQLGAAGPAPIMCGHAVDLRPELAVPLPESTILNCAAGAGGLELVRDDIFAMIPGMPPKMTIFTVGDRLTIQVEYDTVAHSHAQMTAVTRAMCEQVLRLCALAAAR